MRYYQLMENRISDLEKYRNKGLFVSFTNIKRIGTYPDGAFHEHRSPYGIYSYPLDKVYDDIINMKASFSDRPYIYILKSNVDIAMLSSLPDIEQTSKVVHSYLFKNYPETAQQIIDDNADIPIRAKSKSYGYIRYIADSIAEFSEDSSPIESMDLQMTRILKLFGIKALEDDIGDVIGGNGGEKYQTVFFQKDYFEVLDMIINKVDNLKDSNDSEITVKDSIKWIESASNNSEILKRLQKILIEMGNALKDKKSILFKGGSETKTEIRKSKDKMNELAKPFLIDPVMHIADLQVPQHDSESLKRALTFFNNSLNG